MEYVRTVLFRALGISLAEKDVDGERVLGFAVGAVQSHNRIFDHSDELYYLKSRKLCVRIVIGGVANPLQDYETLSEVLYSQWKVAHLPQVTASSSSLAMFQGAVGLPPSRTPSVGAAHKHIGVALGKRVEHRIVGCADGAAQIGLARSASAATDCAGCQGARNVN